MIRYLRCCALLCAVWLFSSCAAPPTNTPEFTTAPTAVPLTATASQTVLAPTPRPLQPTSRPAATRTPVPAASVTAPAPSPLPETGQHLQAFHRDGQTFLTWDELPGGQGERYRLYRSNQPVRLDALERALWLAEVSRGSGSFYSNRYLDSRTGTWQPRDFERYVIQDFGPELPADTGLLVWTLSREDLGGALSGEGYYAVTIYQPEGEETLLPGYSLGPVSESAAEPMPVEARAGEYGTHTYIQYMDLRSWNPTFHAPNELNNYYGLDPADPRFAGAIQYAYDYVVQEPFCPDLPESVPVILSLHPYSTYRDLRVTLSNEMSVWCAYKIYPLDPGDTWWFGFAEMHDFRRPGPVEDGDSVANYTEERVMRMVYDLARLPPGPPVDLERIYVTGHSMGATGALNLAARYPQVFAAAYASDPLTQPLNGGNVFYNQMRQLWGDPRYQAPVSLFAPLDWANPLRPFNGLSVWDWQDFRFHTRERCGQNFVPLGTAHSINDPVVLWNTQGAPFYPALDRCRQSWGAVTNRSGHSAQFYEGLPPNLQPDDLYIPFAGLRVVRSEAVPGLSLGLTAARAPGETRGYLQTVLWSSSWLPWDGAPVDRSDFFQISLCAVAPDLAGSRSCGSGEAVYVNITPRRLQNFIVIPGVRYTWENRRVSDDALLASGRVTAAEDGTLTVRRFLVLPEGSRLILRLQAEQDDQQE